MPTDEWLLFAYFMIFSSVIFCGLLPMILRLYNARQRFHRYDLEREAIEYSCPYAFLTLESIYSDVQVDTSDVHNGIHSDFQRLTSNDQSTLYKQIPFIDAETPI